MFGRHEIDELRREIEKLKVRLEEKDKMDKATVEHLVSTLKEIQEALKSLSSDYKVHRHEFSTHSKEDNSRFTDILSEIKNIHKDNIEAQTKVNDTFDQLKAALADHIADGKKSLELQEFEAKLKEKYRENFWVWIKRIPIGAAALGVLWAVIKALITGGVLVL